MTYFNLGDLKFMCGIAGIINHSDGQVEKLIHNMTEAIAHRGPDDSGYLIDDQVALGHCRLAIIDPAHGHQPMFNLDKSIAVVFNGEIYNHNELRAQLEKDGYKFNTRCDTEVIVQLYAKYGKDGVNKLNGMFAFCIYDRRQGKLLLARDRMGQKPLFYYHRKKQLLFCSELGGLKQHPDLPREYNYQSIHDYLSLQYIPSPSTVYQKVFKLPPAHLMEFDIASGSLKLEAYWRVDFSPDIKKTKLSFSNAQMQLRELLTRSVKRRLMADVPYGVFLSGGLDSSIITGIMMKLCNHPVKAFTIGFDEPAYDERAYAEIVTDAFNYNSRFPLEYYVKVVNPQDFDVLKKLVKHCGEPYSDASMLPMYFLSEFTRQHVTVALSGDGADELFAGYERYLIMRYSKYSDFLPLSLRRFFFGLPSRMLPNKGERSFVGRLQRALQSIASVTDQRYINIISHFNDILKNTLYGERFADFGFCPTAEIIASIYNNTSAVHIVEKIMETDLYSYLPGDILTKVDIASMACSLEVRSPFMDPEVVKFAASLPLKFKQRRISRKHILKQTFADLLPPEIIKRRKKGFGVPLSSWFRGAWRDRLREHLLEGKLISDSFFRRAAVEQLLTEHVSGKIDHSYPLWSLLIFELFLEQE
ncbi:MAG: asparagine synthase (glutamine-hydrolyzing) [Victivallales bacterium]|nr:asparagine synthase (glutamine-hydrolyzing) [Victivallales bacterium]